MFTRTVEEVLLYCMYLNPVYGRAEDYKLVAVSTDRDTLCNWYSEQKASEGYRDDDGFFKTFKKGSKIEMFNPCALEGLSPWGHGIQEKWVNKSEYDTIVGTSYTDFVVVN